MNNDLVLFLVNFNWEDPFDLESQLSQDEVIIKNSCKTFCQEKLQPKILLANRNEGKLD